jgi:hypothetical protein
MTRDAFILCEGYVGSSFLGQNDTGTVSGPLLKQSPKKTRMESFRYENSSQARSHDERSLLSTQIPSVKDIVPPSV